MMWIIDHIVGVCLNTAPIEMIQHHSRCLADYRKYTILASRGRLFEIPLVPEVIDTFVLCLDTIGLAGADEIDEPTCTCIHNRKGRYPV